MAKSSLEDSECILGAEGKKEVDSVICRKTANSWARLGTSDVLTD